MRRHALDYAPLVGDALPSFAPELERLLAAESSELAAQVGGLHLVGPCLCRQSDCATFHVTSDRAAPPAPGYGANELECLDLEAEGGLVVVDVEGGRLRTVEVLGRDDVERELDAVIPPRSVSRVV